LCNSKLKLKGIYDNTCLNHDACFTHCEEDENDPSYTYFCFGKRFYMDLLIIYIVYFQAASGNVVSDFDVNAKPTANKNDEKGGEVKYTNHTLDEVGSMVQATISAFDTKVHLVCCLGF
jgi:hypothetical protein